MLSCLFSNNMAQGSAKIGKCCGSSVVEHSLGKGEVESSILSRSTMTFHSAPLSLISHHLPNIFSPHDFPTTPCWLLIFFVHLQAQCIFKHNAFLLHAAGLDTFAPLFPSLKSTNPKQDLTPPCARAKSLSRWSQELFTYQHITPTILHPRLSLHSKHNVCPPKQLEHFASL